VQPSLDYSNDPIGIACAVIINKYKFNKCMPKYACRDDYKRDSCFNQF
jgi:hypothetical protein